MKNLFQESDYQEIVNRIHKLTPQTQRKWGKMDVAQMMAHCSSAFEVALGDRKRTRVFLGYLFGGIAKKQFVYGTSFKKSTPTDPTFIVSDARDFEKEKKRLLQFIERFHSGREQGITKDVHPFFGKMSPLEWAQLSYNHLNHHLTQFGE
jgi:hypothetical protein